MVKQIALVKYEFPKEESLILDYYLHLEQSENTSWVASLAARR